MRRTTRRLALLLLAGLLAPGIGAAQTTQTPTQLKDVSVERGQDGTTVRVKTTGAVKYDATVIDSPTRLVIDLAGTVYAWPKSRLATNLAPIREIRGSQFKPGVARVVVEMTRRAGYRIDQGPDGLAVVLEPSSTARSQMPETPVAPPGIRRRETAKAAPAVAAKPAEPVGEIAKNPRKVEAPVAPSLLASPSPAASVARAPAPAPLVVAQAQTAAAPGPQAPIRNGTKLISLDFKDADVVNLLRILAAESGRNIVVGDDVKGKVSVSLRNVTWDQALETILEVRGLAKIDKGGVIRIVSLDQLAKEREALARVEEAKRRVEIETRTKLAEAELKEAELEQKRFAKKLAEEETLARGPLREETIRLSYADPDEVARTLQGIMGIPPEGTAPVPIGAVPAAAVPAEPTVVPSSGTINPALGRLPQPNAPMLSPPGTGQAMVSVSQDVLAKGITIRAHKPTNSIFIRHYDKDLERIKKLVREQLDVPLPQVKIEARMEILDRNALEAIGVQWGGAAAGNSGNTTLVGQGFQSAPGRIPGQTLPVVGGVLQPDGSTVVTAPVGARNIDTSNANLTLSRLLPVDSFTGLPIGGNIVNLPFSVLPNAASQIPAGGIAFGIIGTRFNVNLALEALATQGKTRTLARPEIVTVENNKATVSLGEEIPYATVSSAGTQIQFKEALLKLDVTPTVIRERINNEEVRKIKLVVVVENNSRGDTVNLGSGGTPPAINRRKAETQVLIKEGDRLVIGGVTQSVTSNTVRKVPLLGDIPILGWLFKQRENFETGRELVVFVTPSILNTDSALAAAPGK